MDDLSAMLSQVLSDPDSMKQIQEVAASLGLGGGAGAAPDVPALPPAQESPSSGIDMSALEGLIQGLSGAQASSPPEQPAPASSGLDMNALSSLLQNLTAGAPSQPDPPAAAGQTQGLDLSALSGLISGIAGKGQGAAAGSDLSSITSLLSGGGGKQSPAPSGGLPFDINTLFKIQKAMSSMGSNKANVELLMALKPRLKEKRAKKVDDAVRIMQLIQFLPLLKESGLFGDGQGGISGILDGVGSGLGNMLGGLLGGLGGKP